MFIISLVYYDMYMDFFSKAYYWLTDYIGPDEKQVGRFFSNVKVSSSKRKTLDILGYLAQKNIVVINLYSERKYRGYKYLTKTKRKQLYNNSLAIVADFEAYQTNSQPPDMNRIFDDIYKLGADPRPLMRYQDQIIYLKQIMTYLSPHSGRYSYRKSSTFGELLKDPAHNKLVGDCNQIVTLYIYLYSLKYDITDLQLTTYPGHVCLHFKGIDIEATNGQFKKYSQPGQKTLAVQEIVSINLLDISDSYFKTQKVLPEALLQSAKLAYLISSERDIVQNNLTIAYKNIVADLVGKKDFSAALRYARQSNDTKLVNLVGHNGAVHYINNHQYSEALKYAKYANDSGELTQNIYYNQGINYYQTKNYDAAIRSFGRTNNQTMIKQCYIGLYNKAQSQLGSLNTVADVKKNAKTIRHMQTYAKKSGNAELIEYTNSLSKYT